MLGDVVVFYVSKIEWHRVRDTQLSLCTINDCVANCNSKLMNVQCLK